MCYDKKDPYFIANGTKRRLIANNQQKDSLLISNATNLCLQSCYNRLLGLCFLKSMDPRNPMPSSPLPHQLKMASETNWKVLERNEGHILAEEFNILKLKRMPGLKFGYNYRTFPRRDPRVYIQRRKGTYPAYWLRLGVTSFEFCGHGHLALNTIITMEKTVGEITLTLVCRVYSTFLNSTAYYAQVATVDPSSVGKLANQEKATSRACGKAELVLLSYSTNRNQHAKKIKIGS
jgi:hypothetical protein